MRRKVSQAFLNASHRKKFENHWATRINSDRLKLDYYIYLYLIGAICMFCSLLACAIVFTVSLFHRIQEAGFYCTNYEVLIQFCNRLVTVKVLVVEITDNSR